MDWVKSRPVAFHNPTNDTAWIHNKNSWNWEKTAEICWIKDDSRIFQAISWALLCCIHCCTFQLELFRGLWAETPRCSAIFSSVFNWDSVGTLGSEPWDETSKPVRGGHKWICGCLRWSSFNARGQHVVWKHKSNIFFCTRDSGVIFKHYSILSIQPESFESKWWNKQDLCITWPSTEKLSTSANNHSLLLGLIGNILWPHAEHPRVVRKKALCSVHRSNSRERRWFVLTKFKIESLTQSLKCSLRLKRWNKILKSQNRLNRTQWI